MAAIIQVSNVFNEIDDIVEGILRVIDHIPTSNQDWSAQTPDPSSSTAPYKIYNIGNSHPENLLEFVNILQEELICAGVLPKDYDFEAHKKLVPMQPGMCQ